MGKRILKALLMVCLVIIVMAGLYAMERREGFVTVVPGPTVKLSSAEAITMLTNQKEPACEQTPTEQTPKPTRISLGKFRLTAYCPCRKCSGGYGHQTATGVRATEGITIAADPRVLPYGTIVEIDGISGLRIVQDCGGAVKGNKIDIFVENHADTFRPEYNRTVEVFLATEE